MSILRTTTSQRHLLSSPPVHHLVGDLLQQPLFVDTRTQIHHGVRKSDHLLRTARWAYRLAGPMGANQRVCARAALLHDLHSRLGTLANHGAIAAAVAADMGESEAVCRAIAPHMYPLGPAPSSREGWVLVIADKLAAMQDALSFTARLLTGESLRLRRSLLQSDPFVRERRARALLPA